MQVLLWVEFIPENVVYYPTWRSRSGGGFSFDLRDILSKTIMEVYPRRLDRDGHGGPASDEFLSASSLQIIQHLYGRPALG